MERFPNDRETLDFVVSRIRDEALREGPGLSEVERKMLYFSETAWMLPDILEVNEAFGKKFDRADYERLRRVVIPSEARNLSGVCSL